MKSESNGKKFDCVEWTRQVRDEISEEIAGMSGEELRVWFSQRPKDPILPRLFDRRQVPQVPRALDESIGGRSTSRQT